MSSPWPAPRGLEAEFRRTCTLESTCPPDEGTISSLADFVKNSLRKFVFPAKNATRRPLRLRPPPSGALPMAPSTDQLPPARNGTEGAIGHSSYGVGLLATCPNDAAIGCRSRLRLHSPSTSTSRLLLRRGLLGACPSRCRHSRPVDLVSAGRKVHHFRRLKTTPLIPV